MTEKPNLAMATTRELLDEIIARGEIESYYIELGNDMANGAANLIQSLPGSMLDYRSVDAGKLHGQNYSKKT